MNEFAKTLKDGRKLKGAIKDLSLEELEHAITLLRNFVEDQKAENARLLKAAHERQKLIDGIKADMVLHGVTTDELLRENIVVSSRKGQKRPVKFVITDSHGNQCQWTGIGRMPIVFKEAIAKGSKLEDFSVHREPTTKG